MFKIIFKILIAIPIAILVAHVIIGLEYTEFFLDPTLLIRVLEVSINPLEHTLNTQIGMSAFFFVFMFCVCFKPRKPEQYGFSRYANLKDRKKAKLNIKNGIVFGEMVIPSKTEKKNIEKAAKTGKKLRSSEPLSTCVFAPPGTGKTSAFVIPTSLEALNSVVINDPKGEVFWLTVGVRGAFSKIMRFDPMQTYGKGSVFNPFSKNMLPKDTRKHLNYVNQIASVLFPIDEKGGDKFWTENARGVFSFIACSLLHKNGKTSLSEIATKILSESDVASMFEDMLDALKEDRDEILEQIEELEEPSKSELKELKQRLEFNEAVIMEGHSAMSSTESPQTWSSLLANVTPVLKIYATDSMIKSAVTGENEIDIMRFKEKSHTLYIVIPEDAKETLKPLLRVLLETMATKLISVSDQNTAQSKDNIKVDFIIDEFGILGKMDKLLTLPAIARGMGVSCIFIAQSMTQIEETYGEKRARGMFDLISYWLILKQNSESTAEMFSKLIGKETVKKISQSYNTKSLIESNSSKSVSYEGLPLVSADEIKATDKDYAFLVASLNTTRPFRLKLLYWFKDKKYIKMIEEGEKLRPLFIKDD